MNSLIVWTKHYMLKHSGHLFSADEYVSKAPSNIGVIIACQI